MLQEQAHLVRPTIQTIRMTIQLITVVQAVAVELPTIQVTMVMITEQATETIILVVET